MMFESAKYYIEQAQQAQQESGIYDVSVFDMARNILENDYHDMVESALESVDEWDLAEMWNDLYECERVFQTSEIDDIFGRMYPSEVMEQFSEIDFSDEWFLEDLTASSDYVSQLIDLSQLSDDIVSEKVRESLIPSEIVEVQEEYLLILCDIEEQEQEQDEKAEILEKIMYFVQSVSDNGTLADAQEMLSAIWNR